MATTRIRLKPWQQKALKNGRTPLPEFPGNRLWAQKTQSELTPRPAEKRLLGEEVLVDKTRGSEKRSTSLERVFVESAEN
ncbi:unnamed protein product [Fusarium venenatum]|uniref:Uncharacterized protein n=1 Tax=Fusarium venenatum TaxID=56646 RepID=A0A2L2TYK2_9HYPO|nr:uncharacterized protein FVRRES_02577 [Fusarium venenatum]CEI66065.1 unnamed protein product [Fusarium venenatum]